ASQVVYVATMEAGDAELEDRIARHRAARPSSWETIEAPRNMTAAVNEAPAEACVLIDCLSLWVTNRMLDDLGESPTPEEAAAAEARLTTEVQALLAAARDRSGPTVVVTNEVGSGLVPPYPLGRVYRDLLGRVNQQVSATADRAWLLVAGRALELPPPRGGAPR
ncbi:MAG: bifunctional adenosylcobinamide kinase/adenosylcobinamide-phosphate guanylyltransferase, partial [Chloroflexi bacterium]|nr:bifunctional adenosylcobinamide kinase/adenosylcobinamide-phosphate guanylyltransferase [Chloroflexota bacterium]